MNPGRESLKDKNPYKRGADDGWRMGLLLIVLFVAMTQSLRYAAANWIGLLLMVAGVPVATFLFLRRSYVKDNGLTLFSSLWVQGIAMFFCATLILAMFEYLYLRFINPTFIVDTMSYIADVYAGEGTPQGDQIAQMVHGMLKQNLVPSAINMALETIWTGVFTGSLLSAVMAGVVRMKMWGITAEQ